MIDGESSKAELLQSRKSSSGDITDLILTFTWSQSDKIWVENYTKRDLNDQSETEDMEEIEWETDRSNRNLCVWNMISILQGSHAHRLGRSRRCCSRLLHRLEGHHGLRSLHQWKVQEGWLDKGPSCCSLDGLKMETSDCSSLLINNVIFILHLSLVIIFQCGSNSRKE